MKTTITCTYCKREEHIYKHRTTSDGVSLCGICGRYLMNLAKDCSLSYPEYLEFAKTDKQDDKDIASYLSQIKRKVDNSRPENSTDVKKVLAKVIKREKEYSEKYLKKLLPTINKKEYVKMINGFLEIDGHTPAVPWEAKDWHVNREYHNLKKGEQ